MVNLCQPVSHKKTLLIICYAFLQQSEVHKESDATIKSKKTPIILRDIL